VTPSRSALLLVALVGAALPATGAVPATAAPAQCQGRTATIASDISSITGTEGDDVISAGPTTRIIDARGGDDLVCAFGGSFVTAGTGDDSVVVVSAPGAVPGLITTVSLGAGDDTYVGTEQTDVVDAYATGSDPSGADRISTGGGDDTVAAGTPGEPDRDVVDLGEGNDHLSVVLPPGSDARLDGGGGHDAVSVAPGTPSIPSPGWAWAIELDGGRIVRDGIQAAGVTGTESVVASLPGSRSLVVRDGPADTSFTLLSRVALLELRLGGGDDSVLIPRLLAPRTGASGGIDLGGDRGDLLTVDDQARVRADLAEKKLVLGAGATADHYILTGVRNITASAADVVVDGDGQDNEIQTYGCRQVAQGGRGDDRLTSAASIVDMGFTCAGEPRKTDRIRSRYPRLGARLDGQRGDDRLTGSNRAGDVLLGGPGRDRADARGGRDTCAAERETSCER